MNSIPTSSTRYHAGDPHDPATVGFSRVVVSAVLGDVVVHVHPNAAGVSDTATLLLHGAAGSWTTWLPFIRAAHDAGQPLHNVVAVDLPGWGESGSIRDDTTVEDMVDAIAHVTTTLGFPRWNVFGHSLGGHLALSLAARYPERTRSVVGISATGPGALAVLRHPLRHFGDVPLLAGMLGAMRLLSALDPAGTWLVPALHRIRLLGPLSSPLFARWRELDESVINSLVTEIRSRSFVLGAHAATQYDESEWASIECPVTLVRGERDVFVSSKDDAWFASALPHTRQQIAAKAGHFAHIESMGVQTPAPAGSRVAP
ncbi:alpha/beta fold hydrolase [Salinibacterium sp. M195]|uniref:alpha/beta fold hydrolase n=1 Tax=Salinibacterium sp. M195 TaxID=2583374 RepID=UPI001C630654|nr:alpha/beta hydrolase [Salinibacterium sp. M195]QYH36332.1 alpha/beta hydrolase [Salinibacterium sp. M195]